jgi:glutathione S-transferase
MITLHTFGPFMGSPDSSPFVMKAIALLKMANVPFETVLGLPFAGPHQFLPYIVDGGVKIPDSGLIREHIERTTGFDFDAGLTPAERGVACAFERLCEDHLYFAMLHARWVDTPTFKAGLGRTMFDRIPAPARPLVKGMLRRMNASRLRGQGLGRHAGRDIERFGARDIAAMAAFMDGKPFLMGDKPCGADASVFGLVDAILTPPLTIPLRAAALGYPNLVAYRERCVRRWFPEQIPETRAKLRAA